MRDYIVLPRCTVQLAHGEFCDADAAEDMPFPICERHADQVHKRIEQFHTLHIERLTGIPCPECDRRALQRFGEPTSDVTCRACKTTISPDRFRLLTEKFEEEARLARPSQEALAKAKADQAVVYYMRLPGDRIKIGTTTNMTMRLTGLRVRRDAVLATEPGSYDLERMRHKQFADLRFTNGMPGVDLEDFEPGQVLLDHIAMLRKHFGEPQITTYPKVS